MNCYYTNTRKEFPWSLRALGCVRGELVEEELREIPHVNVHRGVALALDPIGPAKLDPVHDKHWDQGASGTAGPVCGPLRGRSRVMHSCEDCGTSSHKPGLVREVQVLSSLRLSVDMTIVLLSDVQL
jgi:hypothetical protein